MAAAITQKQKRNITNRITVFLFIFPALLVYGVYTLNGIVRTFYFSGFNWNGIGSASKSTFLGLQNFVNLFHEKIFWHAVSNNFLLVVVSIVFQLGFGMVLALIVNTGFKGTRFFRTIYFMPLLLSTVATGLFWLLMFDPYNGIFNWILKIVSPNVPLSWLGSREVVMFAVLFVVCWQYTPQYMILLRAGMSGIPEEMYEAATIDGVNSWQKFWFMTLPLLSGTIKTSAVLSIVGSLKYFDLFWVMTLGGPNGYSELMATFMYKKAFTEERMGYGSSVAVCMFIVSLITIVIFRFMTRANKEEALS
jgi:raffinose/stachyose/melibiose transport system permease protein